MSSFRAGGRAIPSRASAAATELVQDAVPDVAELVELGVVEDGQEVPADAGEVRAPRGVELRAARGGQHGVGAAGVGVARRAADEPLALEAVDEPGQAAA